MQPIAEAGPVLSVDPDTISISSIGGQTLVVTKEHLRNSDGKEFPIAWPDERDKVVDRFDIFSFAKIPPAEHALYDLICSQTQTLPIESDEHLKWGHSYTLVRRSCPRCTLCNRICTRKGEHKLCAHGTKDHLWHMPRNQSMRGLFIAVQGYHKQCRLTQEDSGLTQEEIHAELNAVDAEDTEQPAGFSLQ